MNELTRLENFARAGYVARAIVYVALGFLTLATRQSEGMSSVLGDFRALPAGDVLLVVTAIGLFGYAVFRLYGAAFDLQDNGTDVKGIGKRIGHAASGLTHLALCYLAFKLVFGSGNSDPGGGAGRTAQALPGGSVLLIVVGAGLAFAALEQATKAVTAKFMALLSDDAPRLAEVIGRIGYAARAVVFGILSWHVIRAALDANRDKLSFGSALNTLRDTGWPYTVVATGLLLFGIFSLVMARYRNIRNEDMLQRAR